MITKPSADMEDTSLFIKCATNALQHEQRPPGLAAADLDFSEATFPSLQALREASHAAEMVQELITGGVHAPNSWSSGGGAASWTFGATFAQPGSNGLRGLPDLGHGAPPTRRAGVGSMSASYAQDHIIAERKRREKINQRFIELSTVIPGLKKVIRPEIQNYYSRLIKFPAPLLYIDAHIYITPDRHTDYYYHIMQRPTIYM